MNIAIILSGGVGSRLDKDRPKQYIKVGGKPVIGYCVETFCNDPRIDEVVICLADEWRDFVQVLPTTTGLLFMTQPVPL